MSEKDNAEKLGRVAKGKAPFQTQIRADLVQEMKQLSDEIGIPVTILTEKFLEYCIRRTRETGVLPLDSSSNIWG